MTNMQKDVQHKFNGMKTCVSYQITNKDFMPQDFDRLVKGKEEILNTDYSNYNRDDIIHDIQSKLGCFFQLKYINPDKSKFKVYRISNWFSNDPDKESLARALTSFFPPQPVSCMLNRANLEGIQVFYCSTEIITACEEIVLKYGDLFFISAWEFDASGLNFSDYTFGQEGKYDASSVFKAIQSSITDDVGRVKHQCMEFLHIFFSELFGLNEDRFVQDDRYRISASLTYKDMFKNDCAAIVYPSVKDIYKGINFAIRSDIATKRLKPIKVLGCLFGERSGIEDIKFDIKVVGDIRDKGLIKWRKFNKLVDTQLVEKILNMKFTPDP